MGRRAPHLRRVCKYVYNIYAKRVIVNNFKTKNPKNHPFPSKNRKRGVMPLFQCVFSAIQVPFV